MIIGDRVKPKRMIPVSNKKMMNEWEMGIIIDIKRDDRCDYLMSTTQDSFFYYVKRERDGSVFMARDYLWEEVSEVE